MLCPICHQMYTNPTSVRKCGHSFCKDCLERCINIKDECPTCRQPTGGTVPNFLAQALFDEVSVRCPENNISPIRKHREDNKRRKIADDQFVVQDDLSLSETTCSWQGKLSDLNEHIKEHENESGYHHCNFATAATRKRKSDFERTMQEEDKKINMKYEKQINAVRQKMRKEKAHLKLLFICRDWIRNRPSAMSDFVIYLVFEENKDKKIKEKRISGLLCGIPGPEGTLWEGGLFPLVLRWENFNYFSAKFSRGCSSSNICTCGSLPVYNLNRGWRSLEEILISFQNSLARSVANNVGKNNLDYDSIKHVDHSYICEERISRLAKEYKPEMLAGKAIEENMIGSNETVLKTDLGRLSAKVKAIYPGYNRHSDKVA
jgi:ubiquitin-protein ligase